MSGAREFIHSGITLPTLPEVFIKLDEAVFSPRYSLADIADIVGADTGLATRILRMANSALFRFPGEVTTVTRAVTLIGTRQLRDLVLGTTVLRLFRDIPAELADMEGFWRHAIGCGLTARALATHLREPNVEHFYVLGLLHDVGRLLIYRERPEAGREILEACRANGTTHADEERRVLGFDHAEVGQALFEAWNQPASLAQPIGQHHRPLEAVAFAHETALLHNADVLAHAFAFGDNAYDKLPTWHLPTWDRLGIQRGALAEIAAQADGQYDDAVALFLGDDR